MNQKYALGIDIGGTNTEFGLVDNKGNIELEGSIKTSNYDSPTELVKEIAHQVLAFSSISDIIGIGIGAPNGNYYNGAIEFAPNLPWNGFIELAKIFETEFGVKATLTNDANAAAMGEKLFGATKKINDFVSITLGTGFGSGIVINNKIVYGHDGFAGEYGHIIVIPQGRECGCGRKGCLEAYVSSTGVVRSIQELNSKNKLNSKIFKIENPTAKNVFDFAKNGDTFCAEIVEYTAMVLGESLANFTCFSSPKAYVLFGGIAQSGVYFANKVKNYMEKVQLNIYQNKVDIIVSDLHDKNAAILGSSSLAWKCK